MLEVSQLQFCYEDRWMSYDFTLAAGGGLALMGPSGSGKTTLLNLIAGFAMPDSGTIRFQGMDLHPLPPQDRPVTMLFQEHNLFPHLRVLDNVGLGLHPGLRLSEAAWTQAQEALARVGLIGLENRLPGQLSGGQRQRVALARALVRDRPLLLLDEPFANLDMDQRQRMLELVKALQQEHHLTLLLATHAPDDARSLCGQTALIAEGRLRKFGRTEEVLAGCSARHHH